MRFRMACVLAMAAMAAGASSARLNALKPAAPIPAPKVTSTVPAANATGVPIGQAITATFSVAMNASTINAATFTLAAPGGVAVHGTVTYSATGWVAKFTPSASLKNDIVYTATITTGARSKAGPALAANYKWTFTTALAPPTVVKVVPAKGATGVPIGETLSASFSQPMNAATIGKATFTVTRAGVAVPGTVTYSVAGSVARFVPTASLKLDTVYTAAITTGAKNAAGTGLAANYKWTFTTALPPANTASVDFGSAVQTIRGFGGSSAWITNLNAAQADTLFGTGEGQLGLSILRVRIDPSFTTGGQSNWGVELNNGKLATARGATVIATPWTPPAVWKVNTNPQNALWGGSLNTANYADYAKYLESFVSFFANNGVKLHAISMQNEPEENVNYESCLWSGAEMDTWVANNSSVLTVPLMMPESATFNSGFSDAALDDPDAVGHIGIIGGHIYGTYPSYYVNAESKGKEVWMTEHYLSQTGIAGAMALAKEVHDSMTMADYNAYLWWWIFDWPGGGYLNGLVDANGNPTPNGYALAQFSKFVRPGDVRSNATYNPSTNVYVSAYKGDGHYVIVALNLGTAPVSQPFQILNKTVTSVTPYRTSATQNVERLGAVSVANDYFVYSLPGNSITTFVQ